MFVLALGPYQLINNAIVGDYLSKKKKKKRIGIVLNENIQKAQ